MTLAAKEPIFNQHETARANESSIEMFPKSKARTRDVSAQSLAGLAGPCIWLIFFGGRVVTGGFLAPRSGSRREVFQCPA